MAVGYNTLVSSEGYDLFAVVVQYVGWSPHWGRATVGMGQKAFRSYIRTLERMPLRETCAFFLLICPRWLLPLDVARFCRFVVRRLC